jgi:hypothetical protein
LSERRTNAGRVTDRLPLNGESYIRTVNEEVHAAGRLPNTPKGRMTKSYPDLSKRASFWSRGHVA